MFRALTLLVAGFVPGGATATDQLAAQSERWSDGGTLRRAETALSTVTLALAAAIAVGAALL